MPKLENELPKEELTITDSEEYVKVYSIPNTAIIDKITYLGKDDYTIEYRDTNPWHYVDGNWHHFVYVRENGKITTYVNGEKV